MIALDSLRWMEMADFHSEAAMVPELIEHLEIAYGIHPSSISVDEAEELTRQELWRELYDALCHQGDVYPASYAAVPHLIRVGLASSRLITTGSEADAGYFFDLPTQIEIARHTYGPLIPEDMAEAYFAALVQLQDLACRLAPNSWDWTTTRCITAGLAIAKGHTEFGCAISELSPEDIERLLKRGTNH